MLKYSTKYLWRESPKVDQTFFKPPRLNIAYCDIK